MKLLLDTHIWLWSQLEPAQLAPRVARLLKSGASELWLSPLSIWEVLMLCEKERLALRPSPREWIQEALKRAPVKEATLTNDVVLALPGIRLPHRDPADLFLAATAAAYGLHLVTADEKLLAGSGYKTLANP
jgi:PIN domain nuclease of toxin-antitoxin system